MNWETRNTVNTLKITMDLSLTLLSYITEPEKLRICDHTENHNESSDIKKANTTLVQLYFQNKVTQMSL